MAKTSMEELRRMIKQETLSSGRLSSLQLPRDLSLGGTKPKKVYTPNLNVVRNKDKNKQIPVKLERGQKRKANALPGRPHHAHKQMSYMQTEGLFSKGVLEIKRPNHSSARDYVPRESSSKLSMPKITKNHWNGVKKEENEEVMHDFMLTDCSDSDSDVEYDPVVLPLSLNKTNFSKVFKIKTEDTPNIKKEEPSVDTKLRSTTLLNGHLNSFDQKAQAKSEENYLPVYTSLSDSSKLYSDENLAFSVLQLPSSFAGKVFTDDPDNKEVDFTLRHLPEGQIGKICIRKSGKMEMIVKNTKYILTAASADDFVEEVVQFPGEQSIALEPSVVTLGNISEKFTLTPEWTDLFNRAKKSNKFYW